MLNELLKEFCEQRIECVLDQAMWESEAYKLADKKAIEKLDYALALQTSEEQRIALDELVADYNDSSVEYAKVAYQRGLIDGINLLIGIQNIVEDAESLQD